MTEGIKEGNPTHNLPKHTPGHLECPACEEARTKMLATITADLTFAEAASRWLESRAPIHGAVRYLRENSLTSYQNYIKTLNLFFAEMPLRKIHAGHFREYQRARSRGDEPFVRFRRPQDAMSRTLPNGTVLPPKGKTPCPAKPKKINQELGLLKSIMQRAGCWGAELEQYHQPLLDDQDEIPRSLTPHEQKLWLEVSRMSPKWNIVYWYSILAFDTCMSTDELRGLRLGDINMFQRVLRVPRKSAKNHYRERTIELVGGDVLWAVEQLLLRARDLGATEPQHYLFPSRTARDNFDPTQPMSESGIKRQWNDVRNASKLTWFRQYDCRHTAITRLAESGVPIDIIMARAGHVSEKMRRHYTHISQSAQRRWMEHAYQLQADPSWNRLQPTGTWGRKI